MQPASRTRRQSARAQTHRVETLETRTLFAVLAPGAGALALIDQPPVAVAGPAGGYTLARDDTSLRLDATASFDPDGGPLTYQWDLNNDSAFFDADGPTPELTWRQLQALSVPVNQSTPVRVRVLDAFGALVVSPPVPLFIDRPNASTWRAFTEATVQRPARDGRGWTYEAVALPTPDLTRYTFGVTFHGVFLLDESTLDDQDIRVTAPDGSVQWAAVVGIRGNVKVGNGVAPVVTYRFDAPGGTVDVADAGSYALEQVGEIADVFDNVVRTTLGPVRAMTETEPPSFAFAAAPAIADSRFDFTVVYADATAVDVASIDASRLWVDGLGAPPLPGAPPPHTLREPARPMKRVQAADGSWAVTYRLESSEQWRMFEPILSNGDYVVRTGAADGTHVKDVWGNTLVPAEIGRFTVNVPIDGPDVALPGYIETRRSAFGMPGTRITATTWIAAQSTDREVPPASIAVPVDVVYLLSRDRYPGDDDILVATLSRQEVGPKARRIRVTFEVPAGTPAGSYTLLAVADGSNLLNEPNEANNRAEAGVSVNDPHVRFVVDLTSQRGRRGKVAWVTVLLENRGVVPARGMVVASVELRRHEGLDDSPVRASKTFRINLKPGGADGRGIFARLRVPVTVPADWPGMFATVRASVEPDAALAALEQVPPSPEITTISVT